MVTNILMCSVYVHCTLLNCQVELHVYGKAAAESVTRFGTRRSAGYNFREPDLPGITVAVGTIIADRPPRRSVRARLRIRLLRRMSGVKACIGIGMQNTGWRNPPVQDWGKTFPAHLCALTTADQNTLP